MYMYSAYKYSFVSCFSICAFYVFFFPNCLVRISSVMLHRNGKSKHPSLVPDLRESIPSFTIKYDIGCGFFVDAHYQVPFYCQFVE